MESSWVDPETGMRLWGKRPAHLMTNDWTYAVGMGSTMITGAAGSIGLGGLRQGFGSGKPAPVQRRSVRAEAPKFDAPDGGFTANLRLSNAKSRSGHRNAGNKQLHEKMAADPAFRREMEVKHGQDVFERTSTSGSGRRNPASTEWDHNSFNKYELDLRSISNHQRKTIIEGKKGGGWKRFY